jgi:hypothetical protein
VDDRLRQRSVQRDVVIGIVLTHEGVKADGMQLVERGEAKVWGRQVGLVGKAVEDVSILLSGEAVRVGDYRIDGGANNPAGIITGEDRPRVLQCTLAPDVSELLEPQGGISLVVTRQTKRRMHKIASSAS